MDEDVTKQTGIVPYVLSDRTKMDEKYLSIRVFSEPMKRHVYEKQGHKCPYCVREGIDATYTYEDMHGDYIVPWSKGGKTVEDNLQMLCKVHNESKGNKW